MALPVPFHCSPRIISIQTEQGAELHRMESGNHAEVDAFYAQHAQTRAWSWYNASLIPVQTDTPAHFVRDLFFPNWLNRAQNIDNVFLRILLSTLAIVWDLLTLPIRLVTAPPRAVYNCLAKDQHPLIAHHHIIGEHRIVRVVDYHQDLQRIHPNQLILAIERRAKLIALYPTHDDRTEAKLNRAEIRFQFEEPKYIHADRRWEFNGMTVN
jgi:hypothetical protein